MSAPSSWPSVLTSPTFDELAATVDLWGAPQGSRLGPTRELSPLVARWPLGLAPVRRGQSRYLGDVEASLVLLGVWDPGAVARWCPRVPLDLFAPWATYGPLVGRQLDRTVAELRRSPGSRRAVVTLRRAGGVPPCTLAVQFLVRAGRLDVVVTVRSWDLARGLPYDVRLWGTVGAVVAADLGYARGWAWYTAASAHVYEDGPRPVGDGLVCLGPVPGLADARRLARAFVDEGDPWLEWFPTQRRS